MIKKSIYAPAAKIKSMTATVERLGRGALRELLDKENMHPISGACTMADYFFFTVAEVDKDAALEYFTALLDTIRLDGQASREDGETRRAKAFDRLSMAVQLQTARMGGSA